MARRAPETLADYLVVAICPTLIALLVGSLMWFCVEVFYQGEFKWRLLWVMAMFVVAIVGIARISMEAGLAYASLFAVPLAGAVGLALVTFVADGLVVGGPLMLLVWWSAHKLTWDATLIDDTQDASGEGLLQHMGLEPEKPEPARNLEGTSSTAAPSPAAWWERLFELDKRPHAPGVWVVYFSLAALPIFGLGGWFVSAGDPVARARTFGLLVVYVASAMGLLLATSFLGLRRYLRQRKLQMPLEMTSTWLIVGVVMICAMLLVAAFLPRPHREQSLSQLPFVVTSAARKASRLAFGREGTKDDANKAAAKTAAQEGQPSERASNHKGEQAKSPGGTATGKSGQSSSGDQKQGGQPSNQKTGEQSSSSGGKQSGKNSAGDKASQRSQQDQTRSTESESGKRSGEQSKGAKNEGEQSEPNQERQHEAGDRENSSSSPPPADTPPPPGSQSPAEFLTRAPAAIFGGLFTALRWLFYAALVAGLGIAGWIYREELLAAWRKLRDELSELWDWLFGGKKSTNVGEELAAVSPPPPSFSSYADPFLTGAASRMSWPQLVRYTFEALEAWGRDQQCPRADGQTVHEFAYALAAADSDIGKQAASLAAFYSQLAYAPQSGASGPKESLRELWSLLAARRVREVAV